MEDQNVARGIEASDVSADCGIEMDIPVAAHHVKPPAFAKRSVCSEYPQLRLAILFPDGENSCVLWKVEIEGIIDWNCIITDLHELGILALLR